MIVTFLKKLEKEKNYLKDILKEIVTKEMLNQNQKKKEY